MSWGPAPLMSLLILFSEAIFALFFHDIFISVWTLYWILLWMNVICHREEANELEGVCEEARRCVGGQRCGRGRL